MVQLKHFPEDQPLIGTEVWIFPDPEDLENYVTAYYRPDLMPLVFFVNEENSPLNYSECYWFEAPSLSAPDFHYS